MKCVARWIAVLLCLCLIGLGVVACTKHTVDEPDDKEPDFETESEKESESSLESESEEDRKEPVNMDTMINYRASLEHTYRRLTEDKELTIAYFGGSVTAGHGASNANRYSWRALVGKWFSTEFPDAEIRNINLALGESGTYLGAYRVPLDVITAQPDLLFIEYSINDFYYKSTYQQAASQYETIIREVKTALPDTDIVTILVTDRSCLGTNQLGMLHTQAQAHEDIAKAYHIPTIHAGHYLAATAEYSYANWNKYAIDVVHPNNAGYEVYFQIIREFLRKSLLDTDFSLPQQQFVMSPIISDSLFDGNRNVIIPSQTILAESEALGGTGVTWVDELSYSNTNSRGRFLFDHADDTLAFKFNGTEVAAYLMNGDTRDPLLVSIDGSEYKKVTRDKHNPTMLASGLKSGEHIVKIKMQNASRVYVGAIFFRDETLATSKGTE